MKPNTMVIFMAILIALGFGALLYFQNQQMQQLTQALGVGTSNQTGASGQQTTQPTVVSATPTTSSSGIPSQQILVLGGSIPQGTQMTTPTSPTAGPVGGTVH